ncbi:hybrid sensor histidine kinase/response regulator transcription factor [Flavobacterium undicola]|uniref:hybrid sensor histidine kinase/response regulator transcription factor n=1 Tax=Flavobacterium undicola TaxID=1932779 RepID=UPI0013779DB5|nr:two-component regulator propeller domain-containing protein [Flavobacterium undicola]MBA0883897.1 response regulator [Flavobacterium undicola]
MKIKNKIGFLFVLFTCYVQAQYSNLKFENFDTSKGLSSSTCVDIFQDHEGFLWFGTIDGLNKYDGYDFEIYRNILDNPNSISNNRITVITEDKQGRLWIGTSNGLNIFDRNTEKFYKIDLYKKKKEGVNYREEINGLLYHKNDNTLWVATKNGVTKLLLDNIEDSTYDKINFSHYSYNSKNPQSIDSNDVTSIIEDRKGNIWIATKANHLHRYNPNTNNFTRFPIDFKGSQYLNHLPKQVLIDKDGDFWIGNDISHLFLLDINKGTVKNVSPLNKRVPIFHLYQDKKGVIWASTDGDGIFLLDKKKGLLQHLQHNPFNPFSLSNNQASEVLEDKNGIFWIATYNTGLNKLAISKSSFGHYFYKSESNEGLSAKIAQSVLEDSKKRIWIGTDGGGLNLFDEKNGTFKHYRARQGDPNSLSSDKIVNLVEGDNGVLWVCTWDGGLNKFYPDSGMAKSYQYSKTNPFSIGQNTVWNAKKDSEGRIWLGTSTGGLNLFDPVAEKFYQYKNVPGDSKSLISNFVFSLFIDSKNRLFVGTSQGLCVTNLNRIKGQIPGKINFAEIKIKNIQGTRVNYITEDYKKNIWVGTDMGLYELDSRFNLKHFYSSLNGLPNNLVVGIQEDNNRNLWITSKGGLTYFNPKTGIFKNFNTHDGLQGTEFQSKSIGKTHDGRIIVGGINGFNIFNPNAISLKSNVVNPVITEIRLFNKKVSAGESINGRVLLDSEVTKVKEIELKYDQGYISFGFVALNYQNPERVKYAYKMEGLDEDFINAGNTRVANYSNLEPGTYTFEVMASIDGQWDQARKTAVKIKVQSPPWKTWWAYTLYLLVFVFILWYSIYFYTKKVREEKEQELDQMKLNFFINVSHEFRTPLTLILNPVDKILSSFNDPEEVKKSALIIQRSSRRLLHLVNQLLDLRKMDLGKKPLEISRMNIVKFSKDIFLLFEDLAKAKGIDFVFDAPKKQLYGMFDPDKIEKILTNLLSNALKFTDKGGEVTLSIHEVMIEKEHTYLRFFKRKTVERDVEIRVADTGIGLKREQLNAVFQRFFHADSSKSGTGIGLNFIKSLVELHQGEILVESEYQVGSTFIVRLPADLPVEKNQSDLYESGNYKIDKVSITSAEYEIAISNEDVDDEAVTTDKSNRPVVLIVEDNKELRNHLKSELSYQFQVKEAANGLLGLKMIKKFYPDIVISDVMMPEMDGFEMCRQAKNDIETSHIPIILLTARSLEEDRIEGYDTGADEYLSKPFNINVLKARIKNLLEARKRAKERFASIGTILPSSEITTNSIDEAFLDKTTKIVMDNISDPDFSLEDIIKSLGIGRSQFYRKISSITGQNPSNFIRTIRLKYASELLLTKKYSVKELTHMCGFNSSAYFTKTFKELFGMTPTQFVEQSQEEK